MVVRSVLSLFVGLLGCGKKEAPPQPLGERDPGAIPEKYRFAGQPRELVAVLDTTMHLLLGSGAVAFSPDGRKLAGGFGDGAVSLWDVGRLKEVATMKVHKLPISTVSFLRTGTF